MSDTEPSPADDSIELQIAKILYIKEGDYRLDSFEQAFIESRVKQITDFGPAKMLLSRKQKDIIHSIYIKVQAQDLYD